MMLPHMDGDLFEHVLLGVTLDLLVTLGIDIRAHELVRRHRALSVEVATKIPSLTLEGMDDLHFDDYTIPAAELVEIFDTSGGPGGQHANRNETAVRLRFHVVGSSLPQSIQRRLADRLGDIVEVQSSESRSQFRNRALARQQLKEKLEEGLKERPKRRKTRPTRASKRRRVADKRARSEIKRLRRKPSQSE